MDLVKGTQPDARQRDPVYNVVAPERGKTLDLTFCDDMVTGVSCHWFVDALTKAGRSVRCFKNEGSCPYCGKHRPYWLGFVGAWDHVRRERVVLRLAQESVTALALAVAPAKRLSGLRVVVGRSGKGKTGALTFAAHKDAHVATTPKPFDVRPTICLLLGCDDLPGDTYSPKELREQEAARAAADLAAAPAGAEGGES